MSISYCQWRKVIPWLIEAAGIQKFSSCGRSSVITETDGLDKPGATSRESDKITQLEARTRAYGSRKRIYMECTLSTEEGRTWQEYTQGTRSRIVLPCPGCRQWVLLEREHFTGWNEASSQAEARTQRRFGCPECGHLWKRRNGSVPIGTADWCMPVRRSRPRAS